MKKKENKDAIFKLINNLDDLNEKIDRYIAECLTIEQAKKRDYIVRTKYYGKIVDPNIKKDFKEEIEDKLKNTFSGICNNILNFEFSYKDEIYECEDILQVFYSILNKYEYKQIILDTYGKDK